MESVFLSAETYNRETGELETIGKCWLKALLKLYVLFIWPCGLEC